MHSSHSKASATHPSNHQLAHTSAMSMYASRPMHAMYCISRTQPKPNQPARKPSEEIKKTQPDSDPDPDPNPKPLANAVHDYKNKQTKVSSVLSKVLRGFFSLIKPFPDEEILCYRNLSMQVGDPMKADSIFTILITLAEIFGKCGLSTSNERRGLNAYRFHPFRPVEISVEGGELMK